MPLFFRLALLTISLALTACSDDAPPAPRFKPIPQKSSATSTESTNQVQPVSNTMLNTISEGVSALKHNLGTDADPVKVAKALKARPPRSGDEPMLLLDKNKQPMTPVLVNTIKLNYYDCEGVVAPWFRELVVAETNYFAALINLPLVDGQHCVVSVGTTNGLTPGRVSIDFHASVSAMKDCLGARLCPVFRSMSLIEKGTTLYRSYFLSDMSRKLISRQCVTHEGKWHQDKNCYDVAAPALPPQ